MKKSILVFIAIGLILSACTSSQQSTEQKQKEKEIYVFDDANVKTAKDSAKSVVNSEKPVKEPEKIPVTPEKKETTVLKEMNFIVQLGAFSSKDKAEKFVSENKSRINSEIKISYSENVKLFVVQLTPGFATKEEAEKVRNKLWENPLFKDAFIVTPEKK